MEFLLWESSATQSPRLQVLARILVEDDPPLDPDDGPSPGETMQQRLARYLAFDPQSGVESVHRVLSERGWTDELLPRYIRMRYQGGRRRPSVFINSAYLGSSQAEVREVLKALPGAHERGSYVVIYHSATYGGSPEAVLDAVDAVERWAQG